jgi:hypothetical protein
MDELLDKYLIVRFFNSNTADTTQTRRVNRIAVFVNPRYVKLLPEFVGVPLN